jgi:hypothetical protein
MRIAFSVLSSTVIALATMTAAAEGPPAAVAAVAAVAAPVAPSTSPPDGAPEARAELVGFRDGFFLRDSHDRFRFYPHVLVEADFNGSAGPDVHPDAARGALPAGVASELRPHLVLRRARLGFDAELFRRWSVTAQIELGGQVVANTGAITAATATAPAVQSAPTGPAPADVFIAYSFCRCLNLQVGQFLVPFSMDNRTTDEGYPLLERAVPLRGFAVPSPRDVGLMAWGELGPRLVSYELGVFGGDGQNRPFVGGRVDGIGRVFVRPFAGQLEGDLGRYTQLGLSGRYGVRDARAVGYDAPAITTGQGFVLWSPLYTDSLGRVLHVIPSGPQGFVGGELRMRLGRFALQGEGYYVDDDTREAVDGAQLTSTERLGRMSGVGWYAQVSAWPFGDAFLAPEPGISRPRHLDLSGPAPRTSPQGLEVIAMVSGIDATYDGAARLQSKPDAKTPRGDVTVYQLALGANYWQTQHLRIGFYYDAYVTPGSGTASNQAIVPSNLTRDPTTMREGSGHVLHEISARMAATF